MTKAKISKITNFYLRSINCRKIDCKKGCADRTSKPHGPYYYARVHYASGRQAVVYVGNDIKEWRKKNEIPAAVKNPKVIAKQPLLF